MGREVWNKLPLVMQSNNTHGRVQSAQLLYSSCHRSDCVVVRSRVKSRDRLLVRPNHAVHPPTHIGGTNTVTSKDHSRETKVRKPRKISQYKQRIGTLADNGAIIVKGGKNSEWAQFEYFAYGRDSWRAKGPVLHRMR